MVPFSSPLLYSVGAKRGNLDIYFLEYYIAHIVHRILRDESSQALKAGAGT